MSTTDRACPDYPNECVHPWAHARTYAEVQATQVERSTDPAEHLSVMAAAVRDVWRLALQWQGHDDTEQQAGDIFTALSPLVAWEAEHLPTEMTCPTCGPATAEPHPRLAGVVRCGNCKTHLGSRATNQRTG